MSNRDKAEKLYMQGEIQKKIALQLHISAPRVSQLLKPLKLRLKIKGRQSSESSYRIHQINIAKPQARLYLHRLYLSYPLLQQPQEQVGEPLQLSYNKQRLFKIDRISCRLTSKHLIVEGIQLWGALGTPAPELRRYAEEQGDRIAQEAAAKHSLQVNVAQRASKLVEVAITQHGGAKELTNRRKGKIILYQDPTTKKMLYADRTPNPASLESDSDNLLEPWRKFSRDLEEHDAWEQMKSTLQEAVDLSRFYAENIALHVRILKKLDRKLSLFGQEKESGAASTKAV